MTDPSETIEAHLREARVFEPPGAFADQARANDAAIYERAAADPEAWWASWAEELDWIEPWETVLDWQPPFAKWFVGGKLNASANCLDRHLEAGRAEKVAIHWEGEPGDKRTLTYAELHREVCRFANGLRSLGVERGDRVTLYLPMVPELAIAMLACARIGAPHSVVFGGFSPTAVAHRMEDAASRVLVTCDGYHRRGKVVEQKVRADEAASRFDKVERVVVVRRTGEEVPWTDGRDVWWHELVEDQPDTLEPEAMDAEDMLFVMYTSGTTGKPKGIVHTTGGYLVGAYATTKLIFDVRDDDVYWCMADIGWITGHSYIVYGPLLNGITQVMYEGAPDWPEPDRPWQIIEEHGATILYTAPTAIRGFMKHGTEHPAKHDLSSLRLLGSVGEPINPEAWMWYHEHIGGERCPIVDTWWQTETGSILLSPLPGLTATKPGSATRPFPGIDAAVLDEKGEPVPLGKGGLLAIRKPWPSMLRTIWGDDARYVKQYWSKWDKGTYYTADGARVDEDGYFWVMGRLDDVLNVAGHRLSTMEIESALVEHPAVAEAAVSAASDDVKGQVPVAFVILGGGHEPSDKLRRELIDHVATAIGPIAKPAALVFAPDLPKTRSGKIMRRLLADIANGRALGDTTTLADPEVAGVVEERFKQQRASRKG